MNAPLAYYVTKPSGARGNRIMIGEPKWSLEAAEALASIHEGATVHPLVNGEPTEGGALPAFDIWWQSTAISGGTGAFTNALREVALKGWQAAQEATARVAPAPDEIVDFYEREFYPLSNFSSFRVTFKGQTFDTSEAAYHFQRFTLAEDRRAVVYAYSAHDAFRYAQNNKNRQRADWDEVKVDIMRDILRAKAAQHEYVRRKLLETGNRRLVEGSWRDDFWGWGPNRDGQNVLGKLWMEIRAELRAAPTPPLSEGGGQT